MKFNSALNQGAVTCTKDKLNIYDGELNEEETKGNLLSQGSQTLISQDDILKSDNVGDSVANVFYTSRDNFAADLEAT